MGSYKVLNFKASPLPTLALEPKVTDLLIGGPKLEHLGRELLEYYPNVETLTISVNSVTGLGALPDDIFAGLRLNSLFLRGCGLRCLPISLADSAQTLRHLTVEESFLEELPEFLQQFAQLSRLTLTKNRLTALPLWLCGLRQLAFLSVEYNPIAALPDCIINLHKLWYINALGTSIKPNLAIIFAMPRLEDCIFDKAVYPQARPLAQFVAAAHTSKTDLALRMDIWRLAVAEMDMQTAPNDLLLAALRLNYWDLQRRTLAEIARRYAHSPQRLAKGDSIAFLGLIPLSRKGLLAKIKAMGLRFHPQILPSTKHVVVAELPARTNQNLAHCNLLTVKDLLDFLRPTMSGYLTDSKDPKVIENLENLLLSGQSDSLELAFELIRAGGLPDGIVTGLFFAVKAHKISRRHADTAREYLQWLASPDLLFKLRYKIDIYYRYLSAQQKQARLAEFAHFAELDLSRLP